MDTNQMAVAAPPEVLAGRRRRRMLWLGVGVAVLLLAAYAVAYATAGPGIARDTEVLGVDIGGLSEEQAVQRLQRELQDELTAPIPVRFGQVETEVGPQEAGLALDIPATVDTAPTRSWNPVVLVGGVLGWDQPALVVPVDGKALGKTVADLSQSTGQAPVNGGLAYDGDGNLVRSQPEPGLGLDRGAAEDVLEAAFLSPRHLQSSRGESVRPFRLPTRVVQPEIGAAEVERAAEEIAEPAVAEPVQVEVEGATAESAAAVITTRALARSLSFVPEDGSLVPQLDGERLHRAIADEVAPLEEPARDATFDVSSGRPRVVPGRTGRAVLPESLATAVLPVLTEAGAARTVSVPLEESEPEVTAAQAKGLGVKELVAEFTTYYPSDFAPRLTNIHTAADYLDDTLVLPGETFSFNDTVGERTAARGFAAGFIISGGLIAVDYGGGVSQLVTTTFNAAFFSGLEIVEHHPHSFYISRYPEGREATVAWGAKDLRFRNSLENAVYITTSYTNSSVTVRVWGTKEYRIEATKGPRYSLTPYRVIYDERPAGVSQGSCVATQGVPGFKVVVERLFYQGGERVRTEEFRTTYQPEHEVICGRSGPPEDKPDKPDEPTPDESATPDPDDPDGG